MLRLKVNLKWLEEKPENLTNITWGVPWQKGQLDSTDSISLENEAENSIPVQTWPLAYWPDGSVKWTAHSANLQNEEKAAITTERNVSESEGLLIKENEKGFFVNNNKLECYIPKKGEIIFETNKNQQKYQAFLETTIEQREKMKNKHVNTYTNVQGRIEDAQIENKGNIRTVIRLEGAHYSDDEERFLPFILRLYFFHQIADIKVTYTMIHDSDPEKYFIKGLGLKLKARFSGDPWNRHVQLASDEGIYSEPGQLILTRRYRNTDGLFEKQIANQTIDLDEMPDLKKHVQTNAIWNDFKMVQDSANHFKVLKRCDNNNSWVEVMHGNRSKGTLYAGGVDGGIAVCQRKFWQKFPSSLEVNGLNKEESNITIWLWSPDSEAMDLRHYSNDTHVLSAYEGFDEMRATPIGIANTNELIVSFFDSAPTTEKMYDKTIDWQNTKLLVCEPEYYHQTKTLGIWSMPDYRSDFTSFLEQQLDNAFDFYQKEIEQRSWYGFWNYGDVMHTYDPVRHQWCYDVGGYAWQNTELAPNIWLWYSFLRTGKAEIFHLAEAMTRHNSEVDCYHLGEYKGLGSRHNVSHWGCGCKEARISMANLYKFYFYLTADERTGEVLTSVRDADEATVGLDPMREFYPKDEYPTHTRVGPDWAAFSSNWLCEWERTKNPLYLEKIKTGINDLKKMPYRLLSGPTYGYDPKTSHLYHMGDGNEGGYHMIIAFGAPQVWMELAELLDDEEWKDMIAEFGEFYSLSDQEKRDRSNNALQDKFFNWPMFASAMVAYSANRNNDQKMSEKAWELLLNLEYSHTPLPIKAQQITTWKSINEISWITTNTISQWSINTIVCLELLKDSLPDKGWQKSIIKLKK
ncbi:hypothetical protein F9U64_00540 [Gracilibacillus oryzae]|uniref:Tat pathway signal sequence domain protein n=1 Tax=Gracilibacillus oryzae TaxID=1672701 RepID=A0A7C8L222_9BACI|nr:hypothetical protein [Gracilibacillus oryzae]KAB8139393.1 hypothetical protein F9U64_00540 [Gracilibacillus oryzae]